MIIPPFRLYHFAVKLIWKPILVLTMLFWTGLTGVNYSIYDTAIWNEYGWWLPFMMAGTYFLFMDVKLMLIIMRHEEKKKWKRYKLKNEFRE